ncbi:MAG: MFS transporter [Chloroflexi bacterium]|nr:MFS transporter [Chloroflexota bacterium]
MAGLKEWLGPGRGDARLFLLYSALFHIGLLGMAEVLLNFYFVSLGHSPETIAFLQSLPRLAGFLTSVPVSLLTNRIGTRRVILHSTLGNAALFAMLVLLPSLPLLAVNRFLQGFLYGAQQIALAPLMVTLVRKDEQTGFFALHNVVSMAAMSFGSLIGGTMPTLMVSLFAGIAPAASVASVQTPFAYGAALVAAGLVVLVSVVPFLFVRGASAVVTTVQGIRAPAARTPWLYLTLLALPMLSFGFTGGLTFPFYNLFFRSRFTISDQLIGTILSIGWLGMALVPLANPLWEKRFGRVNTLALTMTIAAVAFLGLAFAPTLALTVIAFTVAISFRNVMQPLFQPMVLDHLPVELHNTIGGMSMVMWNIGWFAATAISGHLQNTFGFGFIMQVVAVGVLFTGATVVLIFRKRSRYLAASVLKEDRI